MRNISVSRKKKMLEELQKKINGLKKVGVEYIKCQISDMQGNIREVTLTKDELYDKGMTSVDGSSVFGKIIPPTESDMVLIPDLSTLYQIPWSPDLAKIICNVYYPPKKEGAAMYPFEGCSRSILKGVTEKMEVIVKERLKKIFPKASISNIRAYFAPEVEFLLLPNGYDEERIHLDSNLKNNHYFVSFTKKIDEVMIKIIEYLGLMGLKKEKYHTEVSTFQYEVGIGHGRVLLIADGVMTMKYIIEKVAEAHDLKASFIPKFNRNVNGSGMHVHQNIVADIDGEKFNLFYDPKKRDGLSEIGANYIAGLLKNATKLQP